MPARAAERRSVLDAETRVNELPEATLRDEAQSVTRGVDVAVVGPPAEWRRLEEASKATLGEWLLAETPRFALPLADRKRWRRRASPVFD